MEKLFYISKIASAFILMSALLGTAANAETTDLSRGIVRAVDEAWLSSDIGAAIDKLPFKEGQAFKKGDLLVSFDCAATESQLAAASAKLQVENITLKNHKQLKAHNAIGQFDVDIAKARVDQTAAERDSIAVVAKRCDLFAPFDGKIAQLGVHLFEVPERNARMMQILDLTAMEVDMILPSDWLKWLKPGTKFEIAIDELGEAAPAEVVRVAAAVDPVSQTIKVVGRISSSATNIQSGMSGSLTFWNGQ
jgi:membrane fusion protein, multidrug efflux system